MGTFVSQDSLGDVVGAIIGIAEVVVDLGRNTVLEQVLIVLDGLLIVALGVLGVGVLLGDSRGREAETHEDDQQHHTEGIVALTGRSLLALLAGSLDGILYFHNSSHG